MPITPERFREDYDPLDDPAWEDAKADARADAAQDWLERNGWRCRDCKRLWDPGLHPATRFDPAYVDTEECPECGGPPEDA